MTQANFYNDEDALLGARLLPERDMQLQYLRSVCDGDDQRLRRLSQRLDEVITSSIHEDTVQDVTEIEDHLVSADSSATIGKRVGKFELINVLGRGGMGTVFLAEDIELRRCVALKIPRLESLGDASQRRRFLVESRIAAKLQHPGLVTIYEVGNDGSITYIASELCEDGDLANWIADSFEPSQEQEAALFIAQISDAVAYIHKHGVLHLDLKPSNILLRRAGQIPIDQDDPGASNAQDGNVPLSKLTPLISDFGISRSIEGDATKKDTSLVLGTLLYMSPEQLMPSLGEVGQQSDIYSLGIVLAQILGLDVHREGMSYREILKSLDEDEVSPSAVKLTGLRSDLRDILKTCTSTYPYARYASAEELAADLRSFACGDPIATQSPSTFSAFKNWLTRKARIREAWWICLGCNCVISVWMIAGIVLMLSPLFPGSNRSLALGASVALMLVNNLPMFALCGFGLRGHRWPILPSILIVGVGLVIVPTLVLTGNAQAIPGVYEEFPFFETLNHCLVLGFGLVQLLMLLIARVSIHLQKR
ncbi:MAG: serine/threonine-protein kinase [Planctomycetota bacterium]